MATAGVRGRTIGSAIVEEARRRGVEAIVIGAEPPSGSAAAACSAASRIEAKELGEITAYVLEKAPSRVVVTAPPERAPLRGAVGRGAERRRPRAGVGF